MDPRLAEAVRVRELTNNYLKCVRHRGEQAQASKSRELPHQRRLRYPVVNQLGPDVGLAQRRVRQHLPRQQREPIEDRNPLTRRRRGLHLLEALDNRWALVASTTDPVEELLAIDFIRGWVSEAKEV